MKKEDILKEFDEKTKTYDKDDGFIIYVDGYDNDDFDVDLIRYFLSSKLDEIERELKMAIPEEKEDEYELFTEDVRQSLLYQKSGYNYAIQTIRERLINYFK